MFAFLFFSFFKYSHQHLHSSLRSQLQAIGKFTDPEITFTKSYLFTIIYYYLQANNRPVILQN